MKRPRKEGIGRIGVWVEGISYHNPYPEFETELNHTPHSVLSQLERFLECDGLTQSYTLTLQRLLKGNQTKSQIFKEETEVKPNKDIQTDSVSDNTRLRAG